MLAEAIAAFLAFSLLFYALFAGADFGAGILEAFLGQHRREEQRKIVARAIGPVWEANHVWLILAVVILFVGFPKAYATMSVYLHLPLTAMLVGVILRGCAFTFGHYDPVHDHWQRVYSKVFVFSSFLAPLMLGIVAGATLLGRSAPLEDGFVAAFVFPWANLFCLSIGVFTCTLFAFLAAVYLLGETKDLEMEAIFRRKAKLANCAFLGAGALVFVCAQIDGLHLATAFFANWVSLACFVGTILALLPLWLSILSRRFQLARLLAAAQVGLVLVGWFELQYPTILNFGPAPLTVHNAAAPEATLLFLLYALILGMLLIFPALLYLLRSFKTT